MSFRQSIVGTVLGVLGCTSIFAADATIVGDIRQSLGQRRGLIVCVGADPVVQFLAKDTPYVIHAIDTDVTRVADLRDKTLAPSGLWGRVTVETMPLNPLPHVGNMANVVLVEDLKRVGDLTAAEAIRILAPDGFLFVGGAPEADLKAFFAKASITDLKFQNARAVYKKPRPAGMDEWSHKWHDSTRNSASQDKHVTSLAALQWIGSDPYTWQMRHGRSGGNRVVLVYDNNAGMSRWGTYKEDAVTYEVFDAYSGVLQWKRKFTPGMKHGFDPVVAGDLIVGSVGDELRAIDANTGETKFVYKDLGKLTGGCVADNVVVAISGSTVYGLDVATGKHLWKYESKFPNEWARVGRSSQMVSGLDSYCIVAADGMVFLLEKSKAADKSTNCRLFGLDLKTGQEKWTFADQSIGTIYDRHWYYMGRLMVTTAKGLYSLPVKSRNPNPWYIPATSFAIDRTSNEWKPAEEGFNGPFKNYFGVNGLIWAREGTQSKLVFATKDNAKRPTSAKTWVGYDVETGKETKRIGYDVDGGWQQRCFPDQATPAFILSSNNEIASLVTGEITNYRAFRGMCGEGPFYGNGLYYVPTHYCIFCYPMVRGTLAVSSTVPPATPVADADRLEKGPAYVATATVAAAKAEEWPMYRQNPKRTSGTTATVNWPPAEAPAWKANFSEKIVGPVIAANRVFVTIVNQGKIVALDAKDGKQLWSFVAGPRIDLPPTVHGDQLLFGSHDGYVYCLRASDGALAWRFCAAPERRRMVTCDRVESSWPLMGSILIADGTAYALAGRITRSDGGMHMYALDPVNGAMKWHKTLAGTKDPSLATGIPCWKELEGQMMNNLLSIDGGELRLPDEHQVWQFSAKTGEFAPRKAPPPPPAGADGKVPETPYAAWYSAGFPHLGFDRPTIGWIMHGLEPVAELRHPYENGTPSCFPDNKSTGVIVKRIRKSNEGQFTVLTPATPDQFVDGWNEKTAWKVRFMAKENPLADVYAPVAAGDTALLACTTYDPPQKEAVIRALSLADGKERESVKLPAVPVYDGMAVAYGKVFIALHDGSIVCLSK